MRQLLLFLGGLIGLSSCCWDCFTSIDYSLIPVTFSTDSIQGSGFRRADLQQVYAIRYADTLLRQPLDTLRQPLPGTPVSAYTTNELLLDSNGRSFFLLTGLNQSDLPFDKEFVTLAPYSYQIVVPATGNRYAMKAIQVRSAPDDCGCLAISGRQLRLNGEFVALTYGQNITLRR